MIHATNWMHEWLFLCLGDPKSTGRCLYAVTAWLAFFHLQREDSILGKRTKRRNVEHTNRASGYDFGSIRHGADSCRATIPTVWRQEQTCSVVHQFHRLFQGGRVSSTRSCVLNYSIGWTKIWLRYRGFRDIWHDSVCIYTGAYDSCRHGLGWSCNVACCR